MPNFRAPVRNSLGKSVLVKSPAQALATAQAAQDAAQKALDAAQKASQVNLGNSTTDDLQEGAWNLYFTDRRAQDAVGNILQDSANVTLRYTAGSSIQADLTTVTDSGTGTLRSITRDAYGRITGTTDATITGTDGHIAVANGNAAAGLPTIDLDASFLALIDFLQAIAPSPRVTSDGSYRVTDSGAYRVAA